MKTFYYGPVDDFRVGPNELVFRFRVFNRYIGIHFRTRSFGKMAKAYLEMMSSTPPVVSRKIYLTIHVLGDDFYKTIDIWPIRGKSGG